MTRRDLVEFVIVALVGLGVAVLALGHERALRRRPAPTLRTVSSQMVAGQRVSVLCDAESGNLVYLRGRTGAPSVVVGGCE